MIQYYCTKKVMIKFNAEWSSSVARRAHNPKVVGSNPASATSNVTLHPIRALVSAWILFFLAFIYDK